MRTIVAITAILLALVAVLRRAASYSHFRHVPWTCCFTLPTRGFSPPLLLRQGGGAGGGGDQGAAAAVFEDEMRQASSGKMLAQLTLDPAVASSPPLLRRCPLRARTACIMMIIIHARTHAHTHTHTHTNTHTRVRLCMYVYVCMYVHVCTFIKLYRLEADPREILKRGGGYLHIT